MCFARLFQVGTMLLQAFITNAVCGFCRRMISDIGFYFIPIAIVVKDVLASGAGRQRPGQGFDIIKGNV